METGPLNQPDIYDEEFYNNLQLAKNLVRNIKRKKDKEIVRKWIGKLVGLRSEDVVVKKNRNAFFKYLLHILHKASSIQGDDFDSEAKGKKKDDDSFLSKWSSDNRTYVAAKPLPGQGAMIYMAVSSDPKLGWENPVE